MAYNLILGRPTLNESKAVIVPSLMLVKFEKDDGSVGTLRGDQKAARECYLSDVKPTAAGQSIDLDVNDSEQEPAAAGKRQKVEQPAVFKKEKQ